MTDTGREIVLGRPRVHLRQTGSTNDCARQLAISGAPHGTLVTASWQTAGRGRQGRHWTAPAGSSLLASLLLRSAPPLLPLIAAVAVCDIAGDDAQIKWPNDIVRPRANGLAKLAGILIEGRPQEGWAVLGIGLNVAVRLEQLPAGLRAGAASMGQSEAEIEPALERLLEALERRLQEPAQATLEAWRARDALRGRVVTWAAGSGRAEGIDGEGRLIVALAAGGHTTLQAGEVHLELPGQ
ncbi:MAG TPA: biotin--[acetyl-CoA-carboxylase] ligase [Solirubrobacteraceae bacterium]|nr:biotin--[acetyl-CoA-carboxylase] ligase [Solirubrobacteraceae bacterium]